jgi:hypothetical protein
MAVLTSSVAGSTAGTASVAGVARTGIDTGVSTTFRSGSLARKRDQRRSGGSKRQLRIDASSIGQLENGDAPYSMDATVVVIARTEMENRWLTTPLERLSEKGVLEGANQWPLIGR